ncbi:MAG TPA: M23 family metallopeptidase [Kofleriaceae bacterium]|nr:M23 family metallopeptidase [Kofleriaceae bacterium]
MSRFTVAVAAAAFVLALAAPAHAGNATMAIASVTRPPTSEAPEAVAPKLPSLLPVLVALSPDVPAAMFRTAAPVERAIAGVWSERHHLRVSLLVRSAPVTAALSSPFGTRSDPLTHRRRRHKGIDLDADRGDPVHAAGAGRVVIARRKGSYGRLVIIDHGFGVQTRYAHLSRIAVHAGDLVRGGEVVGLVGSSGRATGPHLHFEIRVDGEAIDPTAVAEFLATIHTAVAAR